MTAAVETSTRLQTADDAMKLLEVIPNGAARALIVVHGPFGPNPHIEDLCRRFSTYGYRTAAPNLFHRTTDKAIEFDADIDFHDASAVARVLMPHLSLLSEQSIKEDLRATIAHLRGQGLENQRIGLIGFCMGSTSAFLASVEWKLGGSVSFYGSISAAVRNLKFAESPLEMAPRLKTPYLGIFADLDKVTSIEEVEQFRAALQKSSTPNEIVRYAGAVHGFHDADLPALYQKEPAEDAERRAFEWLDRHIKR